MELGDLVLVLVVELSRASGVACGGAEAALRFMFGVVGMRSRFGCTCK